MYAKVVYAKSIWALIFACKKCTVDIIGVLYLHLCQWNIPFYDWSNYPIPSVKFSFSLSCFRKIPLFPEEKIIYQHSLVLLLRNPKK